MSCFPNLTKSLLQNYLSQRTTVKLGVESFHFKSAQFFDNIYLNFPDFDRNCYRRLRNITNLIKAYQYLPEDSRCQLQKIRCKCYLLYCIGHLVVDIFTFFPMPSSFWQENIRKKWIYLNNYTLW